MVAFLPLTLIRQFQFLPSKIFSLFTPAWTVAAVVRMQGKCSVTGPTREVNFKQ